MMRRFLSSWVAVSLVVSGLVWTVGCQEKPTERTPPAGAAKSTSETLAANLEVAPARPSQGTSAIATDVRAIVGNPAPVFELTDLDGKTVRLADFKGKVVVLEWFNPECPFVRAAHVKGSLVDAAERLEKRGIVYLAINSAAPGKQGYGIDVNRAGAEQFKLSHPILLDETGAVGKSYGATNTPHLYVVDAAGTLVYRGAIDNSPDGEGESPQGGKLVSYLDEAVTAVLAGQPVKVPETKAYGCAVKYGS